MREGNQLIDVSSAACGPSSTIPTGATQQNFPCTSTAYQFDPMIFYNPIHEFNLDDAEAKLFALMKSPHAIDGCKLVQHKVDKAVASNWKRSWIFFFSHGKVMGSIDESHFASDSFEKINDTYQNAKRKKLKGSIKGNFFFGTNFI